MKKISFLLIIVLLISSVAYGSLDDRIGNHWSKSVVEEDFVRGHFPYLLGDGFSEFSPNKAISINQFSTSLVSLLKSYGYESKVIVDDNPMSREKMASFLGGELEYLLGSAGENIYLPFIDLEAMDQGATKTLKLLYEIKIINGDANGQFSPKRNLSQAEAIIILQRTRAALNTIKPISFETMGIVQSFNGKEEITVIPQDDKVLLTITKEFPTPGYGMEIKNIVKTRDGFKINFNIENPPKDMIQLQVITYKTISLEMDKKDLGDMPYNFILEGYNKIK